MRTCPCHPPTIRTATRKTGQGVRLMGGPEGWRYGDERDSKVHISTMGFRFWSSRTLDAIGTVPPLASAALCLRCLP